MSLGLIRKVSVDKIANLAKLLLGYFCSRLFSKPFMWGMPAAISIEPVNNCNLSCPECPVGNQLMVRKKSFMNSELHHKIIRELGHYLFVINYYFQGEPFLNPGLYEMVRYAANHKIYTITSTNGHFLTMQNCENIIRSGLDRLIISLDGITPEIYSIYRKNGNLEKVLDGIRKLIEMKEKLKSKTPELVVQFIVFKSNQHQIAKAKEIAKQLGVNNIVFKSAQIYDFKNGNSQIPDIARYSRYKENPDGTFSIKSKLKNHCWRMWSNPVITVSGDISVCCFDKNAEFGIGKLNKKSFREVWHSTEYNSFRKLILNNRKSVEICTNCTEGLLKVVS